MRARTGVAALALVLSAAPACQRELPPRGQIVLHVATDAVVPRAGDQPASSTRLPPMVDRVRFDVRQDGAPVPNADRTFAIDEEMLRADRLSIGLLPAAGSGVVSVRVRLFRADRAPDEEPPRGVTLDTTVVLPAVGDDGITDVSVVLRTTDFGKTLGPGAPELGIVTAASVGTYHDARRTRCAGTALPGEVCVPGGAAFFGNPAFRGRTSSNDITEERFVEVSPFFLDEKEITVGAFRKLWPKLKDLGLPPPRSWSGARGGADDRAWCTWTDAPVTAPPGIALDEMPLACVSWDTARATCRALGKDLPSEAQFEYVTSGLGAEWAFPWGDVEPGCTEAVWGRAGVAMTPFALLSPNCRAPEDAGWAAFPGSGTTDRLDDGVLGNGSPEPVVDLAGNLGEWMVDVWARQTDAAWRSVERSVDPVATTPGVADPESRVVRGGDWALPTLALRAGFRRRRPANADSAEVGFRCARRGAE